MWTGSSGCLAPCDNLSSYNVTTWLVSKIKFLANIDRNLISFFFLVKSFITLSQKLTILVIGWKNSVNDDFLKIYAWMKNRDVINNFLVFFYCYFLRKIIFYFITFVILSHELRVKFSFSLLVFNLLFKLLFGSWCYTMISLDQEQFTFILCYTLLFSSNFLPSFFFFFFYSHIFRIFTLTISSFLIIIKCQ